MKEENLSQAFGRAIERVLGPVLKERGFKKTRRLWHRYGDDVIEMIALQASRWSPSYYLHGGIYLQALGSLKTPDESQCQVVPYGIASDTEPALDAGDGRDLERRAQVVKERVLNDCVPALEVWRDLNVAARKYFTGTVTARVDLQGEALLRSLIDLPSSEKSRH